MKYISPVVIDGSTLTATNVPDGDYPDWIAGSYDAGDRVVVGIDIYEALATTSDEPTQGVLKESPTWLRLGYINRWRMFKDAQDSKTTNLNSISVDITPNTLISSLALLGMGGQQVNVVMTDPIDGEVYNETRLLEDIGVSSWWEYFFTDYTNVEDVVLSDLPPYSTAVLTVTVTALTGQEASVGLLSTGSLTDLGVTTYDTTVGVQNFSIRERDGFGNLTIVPRRTIDIVNYEVKVPTANVAFVKRELQRNANTPTLYIGDEDFEGTIIFGVVEDFRLNISTPSISDMTVEVRSI